MELTSKNSKSIRYSNFDDEQILILRIFLLLLIKRIGCCPFSNGKKVQFLNKLFD